MASTLVLPLSLAEASLKVRTGGPLDEEDDYGLPGIWAGVVPVRPQFGRPIDDDGLPAGTPAPASATYYRRRSG